MQCRKVDNQRIKSGILDDNGTILFGKVPNPSLLPTRRSWRAGTDCKSVAYWLSRFESYPGHKMYL